MEFQDRISDVRDVRYDNNNISGVVECCSDLTSLIEPINVEPFKLAWSTSWAPENQALGVRSYIFLTLCCNCQLLLAFAP